MFKFLKPEWLLTSEKLQEKTEFLIPQFLPKENITMWYSKENQGKTWFSLAVAKYILEHCDIKMLLYMDMDNGRKNLTDRNITSFFEQYPNFQFMHRSTIGVSPSELLRQIGAEAYGENYKDCIFIFDATRDFVEGDMHNDTKVRAMMEIMKNIREAGGTVILNHHSTKNGKGIDGSGEFAKSLDNLYFLRQHSKADGVIHFELPVEKERSAIVDSGFSVTIKTFDLKPLDAKIAKMSNEDEAFVEKVKSILEKHENGIGQSQLLESLGVNKGDKPMKARLDSFSTLFWKVEEGAGNRRIFSLL